jgi:nucleotide-binding universal stress UspA family protein
MSNIETPKDHTILIPVDFSETSHRAVTYAVELAKLFNNKIVLLNVISGGISMMFMSDEQKETLKTGINVKLEEFKQEILNLWPEARVEFRVEEGRPYKVINRVAEETGTDTIVMGTNGANGVEQFMGSTTSRVLSSSHVPVVAVKDHRPNHSFDNIVVPIDLTKSSKQKLWWAIRFAQNYGSMIHVIMEVEKDKYIKNKADANKAYVERVLKQNNVEYKLSILDDRKYPDNIGMDTIQYADEINADLIMIMTHDESHDIGQMFLGSYASQIVNSSQKTPVMTINPKRTFTQEGLNLT